MTGSRKSTVTSKSVILFHGDKGGVGKSWTCSIFLDWLVKCKLPVTLVDGDTRNPDVSRMFSDLMPTLNANLRIHDGWMDLTDFMMKYPDKTIVVSMPAGIGTELRKEFSQFIQIIHWLERTLSMFWIINRLPDSVNLLNEAMQVMGTNLRGKVVVKNLFFGEASKFSRWDNSETKKHFEEASGITVVLTELHERTVDKLFADNENIMPFTMAAMPLHEAEKSPHGLTPSENMELIVWLQENHKTFDQLRELLVI
ncbi:hypothetical protein [Candidatus Glomeribacter gigasporarum]|uniref:nucleotide-binding protein n=1 Tax=Candidatus Glomeribacter gigasporarum TaxID=132144 RepID=UPI001315174F|nr:hypothetical protein [Candidatus Glomeribacter gigasporarum]